MAMYSVSASAARGWREGRPEPKVQQTCSPEDRLAADEGVPAGTLHAIAARVPAETLTAAAPVTGPDGNSRTARSAAEE